MPPRNLSVHDKGRQERKSAPLTRFIRKATRGCNVTITEVSEDMVIVEGDSAQTASRLIETALLNKGKGYFVEYAQGKRPEAYGFASFTVRKHDAESMYTA